MRCWPVWFFGFLLAVVAPTQAQIGEITKVLGLGKSSKLSDDKIIAGLKEALRVGTDNTVVMTLAPPRALAFGFFCSLWRTLYLRL